MACQITVYLRPGCHLCEEAEDLLLALAPELELAITRVNILEEAALYERYRWSIPVIVIAGGATLAAPIDEPALRQALAERTSG